jgi:hypothetical protein
MFCFEVKMSKFVYVSSWPNINIVFFSAKRLSLPIALSVSHIKERERRAGSGGKTSPLMYSDDCEISFLWRYSSTDTDEKNQQKRVEMACVLTKCALYTCIKTIMTRELFPGLN